MKHTKDAILSQALKLFNRHGFVNVRLQHIADAGGISVGHLAYHFKNKDAIIELLYDQLKEQQEVLLYDFRTSHLFEDINQQMRGIFQLQKKYLFFYLDTLEVLRAYSVIKEKHQQHITWQLQQIEWMFEFNIFRGTFKEPAQNGQYKKTAWLLWIAVDNWMHARAISSLDHLNEADFLHDIWSLLAPYFTEQGRQEFTLLFQNTLLHCLKHSISC
ncbi:MAG: TetR/AcrR family transcriptional regulator [Chitinophagaceae bacterium]